MQIALALHNYESTFDCYPAGSIDEKSPISYGTNGNHKSWTVSILPFIEQTNLFRTYDPAVSIYSAKNKVIRKSIVPPYLCPSDWAEQTNQGIALGNYCGIYNDTERPIDANGNGILFLNSRVRYEQITDGSSNTFLIAEKLRGIDELGWASGTRDSLRNMSGVNTHGTNPANLKGPADPLIVGGPGSAHAGVFNGALADGSVRSFSTSTSRRILTLLANRHDGEPMSDPD